MKLRYGYKVLLWTLGMAGGIFAVYALTTVGGQVKLPDEFITSRREAAIVSQKIVDLTQRTNEKIRDVNTSDFSGNPDLAFSFIKEAQENNVEAYTSAVELSGHLQKLAESLNKIKSAESQQLAYEAVTVEVGLISQFFIYTQKLNSFLENLTRAIATDLPGDRKAVQASLDEVNLAVDYLNQLNKDFNNKMEKFDKSL